MLESFALSGNYTIFKMADTKWRKWPICLPNRVILGVIICVKLNYHINLGYLGKM